jgi:predicted Zn finger-like uncharacterized protein
MQIVCPNCTTSYAVDPAKFSPAGRSVRCARCHQVWLARPEYAALAADAGQDHAPDGEWADGADPTHQDNLPPDVQSPPLAGDWDEQDDSDGLNLDQGLAGNTGGKTAAARRWLSGLRHRRGAQKIIQNRAVSASVARLAGLNVKAACAIMGLAVMGIMIWRADIVRTVPQTAAFFRMTGFGVNLRGLDFDNVTITTETVGNKPVLVIQGAIVGVTRKPVEIPRLRFVVRDTQGTDIYAWNAVLEQPVLNPGDRATFTSRLASPPPEGREIAVRFFQRRDLAAGGS